MSAEALRERIREIPDFPKPGILFYDITTLLKDPAAYKEAIDLMLASQVAPTTLEAQGITLFTTPINQAVACSNCHGDFNTNTRTTGPIVGQMAQISMFSGYFSSPVPVRLLFHNTGVRPINEDRGRGALTAVAVEQGSFRTAESTSPGDVFPRFAPESGSAMMRLLSTGERA